MNGSPQSASSGPVQSEDALPGVVEDVQGANGRVPRSNDAIGLGPYLVRPRIIA